MSYNQKASKKEKVKNLKIYPIMFLTLIVLVSVVLLVVMNRVTKPIIQMQQESEIKSLLGEIFPDMDDFEYRDEIYFIYQNGENVGYAFLATGKGYGGEISILVGVDTDFNVNRVIILSHSETPGLGAKITEDSFTNQFRGLSLDEIALTKEGGKVDTITGATISSRAVVEAIRNTIKEKVSIIQK